MPRTTVADLEKRVEQLEAQVESLNVTIDKAREAFKALRNQTTQQTSARKTTRKTTAAPSRNKLDCNVPNAHPDAKTPVEHTHAELRDCWLAHHARKNAA